MLVDDIFVSWQGRVEACLQQSLSNQPEHTTPSYLLDAMRHATLAGGKRMRPLLVYASGYLFEAEESTLDKAAAAIELIHTYSLIHDDLPSMDDDDLRRGQPTVHVAFDEATAILAGDALQALAFELLSSDEIADKALQVAMIQTLARAAGGAGMCGGQVLDIQATGNKQNLEALQQMHRLKTGALIRASVRMGALTGGASSQDLLNLDSFADALGLAFQMRDDMLDIEASSEQLGKTAGKDESQDKSTYPALLGVEGTAAKLDELAELMQQKLAGYGERANALRQLAELAIKRSH